MVSTTSPSETRPTRRGPRSPPEALTRITNGAVTRAYRVKQTIFVQGDPADAVFYLQSGQVRLTIVSRTGKEAILAILDPGSFFGEGCLAGRSVRVATATASTMATVVRIAKETMTRRLRHDPELVELFTAYLLSRNVRIEDDLVDQLFNPSEQRLARLLLLLAHVGDASAPGTPIQGVSQESLAEMIGTTRSRVSRFMNRFRRMGFVDYEHGGLRVQSGLLTVVLRD
jgi:CRP/FNR family transcriptional regulator, cyclic AMP receptor protein